VTTTDTSERRLKSPIVADMTGDRRGLTGALVEFTTTLEGVRAVMFSLAFSALALVFCFIVLALRLGQPTQEELEASS